MPRTKVKLAFIEDNKARRISFLKRKESLKKKLHELCILCDVEACMLLCSPYEPEIELWPEDKTVFQTVLSRFLCKPPMERSKNTLNQESYIKESINKAKEQLNKQMMANREIVKAKMMSDCLSGEVSLTSLNLTDLNELVSLAGLKLSEIDERIELLKGDAPAAAPTLESQKPQLLEVVGGSRNANKMATEGTVVDAYVPVMENCGALDDVENVEWYPTDWFGDQEEDRLDLVPGPHMMQSFLKDPKYSSWSDAFFPKNG